MALDDETTSRIDSQPADAAQVSPAPDRIEERRARLAEAAEFVEGKLQVPDPEDWAARREPRL